MTAERISPKILESYTTQTGETLSSLLSGSPVLLVFLRHFGCTFCREAISEIRSLRKEIEALGTRLAFVHLSDDDSQAQLFFSQYGLADLPRVSDPPGKLYESFGLARAKWRQYINSESILRALINWLEGNWLGWPAGDVQRMPGLFLISEGEIRKAYRHKLVSDRPDYLALANLALRA